VKKKYDTAVLFVIIMIMVVSTAGILHVSADNNVNSGSIEGHWYCYTIEGYDSQGEFSSHEGNIAEELTLWIDEDVDPSLFYGVYSSEEGEVDITGIVVNGVVECQFVLADQGYVIRGQINSRLDAVALVVSIEDKDGGSHLYYCNYLKYGGRGVPVLFKNMTIESEWVLKYAAIVNSDNEMMAVSIESLVVTECKDKVFRGFMNWDGDEVTVQGAFIYHSSVWSGLMTDDLGNVWYLRINDNTMTVMSFDASDATATKCVFTSDDQEAITYAASYTGDWVSDSVVVLSSKGETVTLEYGTLSIRMPQSSDPFQNNNKLNLMSAIVQSNMENSYGKEVGGVSVHEGLMNIQFLTVNEDRFGKVSGWFSPDGEKLYLYGIFVYDGQYYSECIVMQKVH